MTAPVYELRTYTAAPGRMDDLLARFRDHTVRLFERHGIESVGYWTAQDSPDTLVYLLRHRRAPEDAWADFKADPEWGSVRECSLERGPLTTEIASSLLTLTDFSPVPGSATSVAGAEG